MSLHLQRPSHFASPSPDPILASPKRKRDTSDPSDTQFAPPPTRLRTADLPPSASIPDDEDLAGDRSPRAAVAGHFQNLSLTGCAFDFGKAMEKSIRSSTTMPDSQDSDFTSSQTSSFQSIQSQPMSPRPSNTGSPVVGPSSDSSNLPLEIPETPRLKPTTMASSVISPIQRSKSPPPLALWWADTEITGHNPTDPADDGYGINGVGFLPTPALASARAERRKRQVAEWKSREARDARQRRSEARRRRDFEMSNEGVGAGEGPLSGGQQRRVRFLEV